ncbi:MAG: flippase [Candidatus Omnitrophica bacterium]|nr:flippase [Candidatus Omnitrophota bacterium]
MVEKKYGRAAEPATRKILMENALSLVVLQAANYVLPLLTLPYLARILRPEQFGLIALAGAVTQYFMMATDYGFNFSATKQISVARHDPVKVREIFSAVLSLKIVFSAVGVAVFSGIIFSFAKLRADWPIYLFAYGMVIGNALFPLWFFQGIEQMKYITVLNIAGKTAFTLAIFFFVHSHHDYWAVPLITSCGGILTGLAALWLVHKQFSVGFARPSAQSLAYQLREGWQVFVSTLAMNVYTTSNVVILGIFANANSVAYYAGAEKIIGAAQRLMVPIAQAVYPRISYLSRHSPQQAVALLKKITRGVAAGTFIISGVIFVFADTIVNVLLGGHFVESIPILRILACLPFVIGVASMYATVFLVGFGYTREWSRIIAGGALVDIVLIIFFVGIFRWSHIGISVGWVAAEVVILLMSYTTYRKKVQAYR